MLILGGASVGGWAGLPLKGLAPSLGTCSVLRRRPPDSTQKPVALRNDVAKQFRMSADTTDYFSLFSSLLFSSRICRGYVPARAAFCQFTGRGPTDLPYGVLEFRDIREAVLRAICHVSTRN